MKRRKIIILVIFLVLISSSLGGFIGVNLMSTHNKTDTKIDSVKKLNHQKIY